METKNIDTDTNIYRNKDGSTNESSISIKYNDKISSIKNVFLVTQNVEKFTYNSVEGKTGDLFVRFDDYPKFNINIENGDLVIIGEEEEVNKYSINSNGELECLQ